MCCCIWHGPGRQTCLVSCSSAGIWFPPCCSGWLWSLVFFFMLARRFWYQTLTILLLSPSSMASFSLTWLQNHFEVFSAGQNFRVELKPVTVLHVSQIDWYLCARFRVWFKVGFQVAYLGQCELCPWPARLPSRWASSRKISHSDSWNIRGFFV